MPKYFIQTGGLSHEELNGEACKPAQGTFRSMFRLKDIASLFPALLLIGSVLWLTAALQMLDRRLSGLHEFNNSKAGSYGIPAEIDSIAHETILVPPAPVSEVREELPGHISYEINLFGEIGSETKPGVIITDDLDERTAGSETEIFTVVVEPPVFPGGPEALSVFLSGHIHLPAAVKP